MYVVIFISHLFLLSLASEKSNVSDWSIIPKSNLLCDLECACPCPAGAQSWFSLSFCSVQGSRLNFCNQWLSKCYLFENNTVISLLTGTSRPNPLKYRHRRGYSSVISLHWTMLGVLLGLLVTGTLCQSQNIAYHRELTVRRNNIMKLYLSFVGKPPC